MTGVMTLLCIQFSMLEMTRPMLFTIFYGMMTTILPGIYVLVTANKLLASQVDRGSMAYVLSTPTKRASVTFTQAFYLVNSLIVMFAVLTTAHLITNNAKPISLAELGFRNLSGSLSGTFIGVSILANMLAMFGTLGVDGLDKFKYLTVCSFYDYQSVLTANNDWITKLIFPIGIALAAFTAGRLVFSKKDLPL